MLNSFYYQLFVITVIGLILGSFYNVLIFRTLSNESILFPASKCPQCGNKLMWWQNIPVFSYLYLKGKCYFCDSQIDIQYPIVEILTAGIMITTFTKYGLTLLFIKHFFILSILLILSVIDIKEKEIPQKFVYVLALGLLFSLGNFPEFLYGGFITFGVMIFVKYLCDRKLETTAIGEGDVAVLTILGCSVNVLYLLCFTLIAQFFICAPAFIKKIVSTKQYDIIKYGLIFLLAYSLILVDKFYIISFCGAIQACLYLFLAVSAYFLSKTLYISIKISEHKSKIALLPAIFLGYFVAVAVTTIL